MPTTATYTYGVEIVRVSGPITEVSYTEVGTLEEARDFAREIVGKGVTSAEVWCVETDTMVECFGPRVML